MKTTCPHGDRCPGCSHLGVDYELQLESKRDLVRSVLSAYPELRRIDVEPVRGATPVEEYRTRVKWVVGPLHEIGLYADRHHAVVDTPFCRIAGALSLEVGNALRALLKESAAGMGSVTAVDIREVVDSGDTRALVTLVADPAMPKELLSRLGKNLQQRVPKIASVFVNRRDAGSPQILGRETRRIVGPASLIDEIGSVKVVATPGSFVQAHRGQAAFLESELVAFADRLRKEAGHAPRVLELHAGSGAFGLALARAGADVTAVESFGPAVAAMGDSARAMGVTLNAVEDDAEHFVRSARGPWDLVLVDPPRRGLTPSLRERIAALGPRAVAYVSCDPETFARDAAHLARLGFTLASVQPIDMLPLTAHVELLAFARPTARPPPIELARSRSVVLMEKPPHTQWDEGGPEGARPLLELPRGATGVLPLRLRDVVDAPMHATARVRCVVSRVTRKGGTIRLPSGKARYERLRVVAGHSEILLHLDATGVAAFAQLLKRLATFGHRPLGDLTTPEPAALRHAFDAYGIDRPLIHVEWVKIACPSWELSAESPVAADFQRALLRLSRRS